MSRSVFTLRLPSEERMALEHLSQIEGRPMNQLLNEAVKSYLGRQSVKERSLEDTLASLREYRKRDPGFSSAISNFVVSESGLQDPVEGTAVEGQLVDGRLRPTGPVQSRFRELLSA